MLVIDTNKDNKSKVKRTHLGFEDFLEALCRLAALKALPTDEEIAESGYGNAGTHLINMAAVAPEAYERLLQERAVEWGQPPQLQPIERCVEHVCHMMIVHCQGGSERTAKDFALSQRQVRIIGLNEG